MDSEKEIAILNERIENLRERIARFTSHLDSEQRVTGNISKRVDTAENTIKQHHEFLMKFDRILLNEGRGLSFRIDRLERAREDEKDNKRWGIGTIISVVSIILSIAALIIMIVK